MIKLFENKPVSCFLACTANIEDLILLKDYGVFNPLYWDLIEFLMSPKN